MNIVHKKYSLFPEEILVRDFIGKVNEDDIVKSWGFVIENKMITPTIKGVINNLVGCELNMDMNGFKVVIEYFKKHKQFKDIKLAVVCDSPGKLVFPMLGEHRYTNIQIRPFSSVEAAVNWIIIG
ncbi:MAG: hypothetical protein L3J54_01650 [Draconibacterium sp.]|nr:hypothetical protein [Draconibacterium sp.]